MNYCTPYCPPQECPSKPKGKCVLYSGVFLPSIDVIAGQTLDEILLKIDSLVGAGNTSVQTLDTPSVELVGNGTSLTPLAANVKLNPSPINVATITTSGLLVNPTGFFAEFSNSYFTI